MTAHCCRPRCAARGSRIILFAAAIASLASLHAQTPGGQAVERADLLRSQSALPSAAASEPAASDEAPIAASPNDPDLGDQFILRHKERYRAFTVSLVAPFSYTSNVALSRTDEKGDVLFTPGVSIIYAPHSSGPVSVFASVGQQFLFYDKFSELDFSSFDARVGLAYTLPELHNLLLRADYSYNRLTPTDSFDAFFSNHALTFSAELPFRIDRVQQVSLGTAAEINLHADPEGPGRHEFSIFAGYAANVTRALTLSAVARLAVRDYTEGDRRDVGGILALNANYRLLSWLSVNATTTLATNNSNQDAFDYNVANIGGALALALRF